MNNNKIVAETKSRHTARPRLVTRGTGGYEDPGVPCLHDADIILPIVPQRSREALRSEVTGE